MPQVLTPANPSASIGLAAVNGSSPQYMRADAAQALSQAIAPTWIGLHTFSRTLSNSSGVGVGIAVTPTLSTTSTGGWTVLKINATQTSDTGNGTKLLQDWQVGGVSLASMDNTGSLTCVGIAISGSFFTAAVKAVTSGNDATVNMPTSGCYVTTNRTGNVALTVQNINGSGTADLLLLQDSAATKFQVGIDGKTAIGSAGSFGGGTGAVVFIANRTAAPGSNPTGGGILYVESGSLKFRGSSGTVSTIAPA